MELAPISLQKQNELKEERAKRNFKNMPSSTTTGFRVYFTKSYLEKFGHPFYKNIKNIPKPTTAADIGHRYICVAPGMGEGIRDIPCLGYDKDNEAKYLKPIAENLVWGGYTNAYIWVTNCVYRDRVIFFSIVIEKTLYTK